MIKIIDELLDYDELKKIQDLLLGHEFPWYFNDHTTQKGKDVHDDFQLIHAFYLDGNNFGFIASQSFKCIEPILEKIGGKILIRAKANLRTVSSQKDRIVGYHTDCNLKGETAIFYVNTNNGYTIFKDSQKKVECVENRLVTFPSNTEHCGVSCTDKKQRIVINFNYIRG